MAVAAMRLWRMIVPDPEMYFFSLLFHVVEIIIIMFFVKHIIRIIPDVFDESSYLRDNTLISATVLLLVDWEKLNATIKSI